MNGAPSGQTAGGSESYEAGVGVVPRPTVATAVSASERKGVGMGTTPTPAVTLTWPTAL